MLRDLLSDTIEDAGERDLLSAMKAQRKIIRLLEGIGVRHPLRALYQVKRAIATDQANTITIARLRQWGK